ncbi:MAG: CAP domain-containing protein [Bacteroidetes bacterium]|nr:CAP domain-containing protein [Bacteroidota bacterium]MDA0943974.1 CAP domain-containing protein [Bacteroidota bacterium]
MKKRLNTFLMIAFSIVFCRVGLAQSPEVLEALNYLNSVRANPGDFSSEIGVYLGDLQSKHSLNWNAQLANAAQYKAQDMANRNYFGHVNPEGYGMNHFINQYGYALNSSWLNNKSDNFFESLSAGRQSPKDAIVSLISDGGERVHLNAGHRVHLLSLKEFYDPCYDIGIGWAYNPNSTYKYYCCVLIAKHDW